MQWVVAPIDSLYKLAQRARQANWLSAPAGPFPAEINRIIKWERRRKLWRWRRSTTADRAGSAGAERAAAEYSRPARLAAAAYMGMSGHRSRVLCIITLVRCRRVAATRPPSLRVASRCVAARRAPKTDDDAATWLFAIFGCDYANRQLFSYR